MLGVYFMRKRRKKGLFSGVHFVFLVLSLRLKRCLRFVLRIIYGHKIKGKCLCKYFPFFVI